MSTVGEPLQLYMLLLPLLLRTALAMDIFCGSLSIFEQQRFGLNSVALSSQETADLKQCLELCCSVLNCHGVTFTGVITPHLGEPNCLLVGCGDGQCEMNERAEYSDGLVSVLINRTQIVTRSSTNATLVNESNSITSFNSTSFSYSSSTDSAILMTTTQRALMMTTTLAPVWVVGLAVVVAVVCVGLNLGLMSAYICYRRQRSHKHTAHISANMGARLHAYNPTL